MRFITESISSRFILLGTIVLSLFFMSYYPYEPLETLAEQNLKGKVKTVIDNVSHWIDRAIVIQEYNTSGQLSEIRYYIPTYTYNENRDSLVFEDYKNNLDTNQCTYSFKICYKYNKKGNKISKEIIGESSKTTFKETFLYNKKDSLIQKKRISYYPSGVSKETIKYSFNSDRTVFPKKLFQKLELDSASFFEYHDGSDNVIIKQTYLKSNTENVDRFTLYIINATNDLLFVCNYKYDKLLEEIEILNTLKNKYDNANMLIEEILCIYDYNELQSKQIYFYEYLDGQLQKQSLIDHRLWRSEYSTYKYYWEYNDKGDVKNYTFMNDNDTVKSNTTFVYDENNNWIQSKTMIKDSVVKNNIRQIYYMQK